MAKLKLINLIRASTIGVTCLFGSQIWAEECATFCDPCAYENKFYLGADFLYWTVSQKDLDFHVKFTGEEIDEDSQAVTEDFKVNFADYGWNSGFRVFLGYGMGPENWELCTIFTYFNDDANGSVKITESPDSLSLHAKNKLKYRIVDLLLLREYQMGCASTLQPFIGFRALWLDQDYFLDATLPGENEDSESIRLNHLDSDLFAAGIYGGLDWRWEICPGFGFFAGAAGSLLQGDIDNKHSNTSIFFPNLEVVLKEDQCLPVAGYHLDAGVCWESCFELCGYCTWVTFGLSYEFNQWFNVPEFARDLGLNLVPNELLASTTNSNIVLQGLTFRANYQF